MDKKDLEKRILESSSQLEVRASLTREEAWDKIQARMSEDRVRKINFWTPMKIAASITILLVASITLLFFNGKTTISTSGGELTDHELPDGSVVTLNANSKMSYNSFIWFASRTTELDGEAFFEVEKGQKFDVITNNGIVSVLGTKFNVSGRGLDFEVACFEGKVSVSSISGESEKILTEGLATRLDNNKLTEPFSFNKDKFSAWKNGLFFFEKESLSYVFDEIENYYGVQIIINEDITDKKFSGVFNKSELKNVLEIVCSSMGLQYSVEGEEVTVTQ